APSQPRGPNPPGGGGTTPTSINPPVIFEPTYPLAVSELGQGEIWIAISGNTANDANWGGAQRWFSEDGSTYQPIGTVLGKATEGSLLSSLPSGSDPDTTNTIQVDLSESGGVVDGISHGLADKYHNLAIVDDEIISFADVAAGGGTNQFN